MLPIILKAITGNSTKNIALMCNTNTHYRRIGIYLLSAKQVDLELKLNGIIEKKLDKAKKMLRDEQIILSKVHDRLDHQLENTVRKSPHIYIAAQKTSFNIFNSYQTDSALHTSYFYNKPGKLDSNLSTIEGRFPAKVDDIMQKLRIDKNLCDLNLKSKILKENSDYINKNKKMITNAQLEIKKQINWLTNESTHLAKENYLSDLAKGRSFLSQLNIAMASKDVKCLNSSVDKSVSKGLDNTKMNALLERYDKCVKALHDMKSNKRYELPNKPSDIDDVKKPYTKPATLLQAIKINT